MTGNFRCSVALAVAVIMIGAAEAPAQTAPPKPLPPDAPKPPYKRIVGPETLNPGDYPAHFPYPDEYDSAVAASEVHHVRYVDAHIRLVEVAYFPGVHGQMHGHPFPSVFAVDAPVPKGYNVMLDPDRPVRIGRGQPPKGMEYPICRTMAPQSPHAETNQDTWPHHFYRLEFWRTDDSELAKHWKDWYPTGFAPWASTVSGKPPKDAPKFSPAWPYPIAYDSVRAAPNSNKLLYEDDHVRLVEVLVLPGETEKLEGLPYPSVEAFDSPSTEAQLHSSSSDGHAPAPAGFDTPTCTTTGTQPPHAIHNTTALPIHFYIIEFKRIDGDGIKTHWREWYPWMATLTDAYKAHPYRSNYY